MSTADSHPRSANPATASQRGVLRIAVDEDQGAPFDRYSIQKLACMYASQLRMPAHKAVLAAAQRRVSEKAVRTVP
jgi:hypothetical protein